MAETADAASLAHASMAEKLNWSLLLVKDRISTAVEHDAREIRDWLYGVSAAGHPAYLTAALRKHGVAFGLLEAERERADWAADATGRSPMMATGSIHATVKPRFRRTMKCARRRGAS